VFYDVLISGFSCSNYAMPQSIRLSSDTHFNPKMLASACLVQTINSSLVVADLGAPLCHGLILWNTKPKTYPSGSAVRTETPEQSC
jgi:hypothetical protein